MRFHKALIVAAAFALASADIMTLSFSIRAMDCCVKAGNRCAGIKTADDCCQGMGHGLSLTTGSLPIPSAHATAPLQAILVTPPIVPVSRSTSARNEPAFKRPHDPPHLHPVHLLI